MSQSKQPPLRNRGVGYSVGRSPKFSDRARVLSPLESRRAFLDCAQPVSVPAEYNGGVEFFRCCGLCPSCLRWMRLSDEETRSRLRRRMRRDLEPPAMTWDERMKSLPPVRSEEEQRGSDWPQGRPSVPVESATVVSSAEVLARRILEYSRRFPEALRPFDAGSPSVDVSAALASSFHADPVLSAENHLSLDAIEGYRFDPVRRRAVMRARKRDRKARLEGGSRDPDRIMESLPSSPLPLPGDDPQGSLL